MGSIKSEYDDLKERRLYEQTDIIDRIDNVLDNKDTFFVNTTGNQIYDFFIPEHLKDDRSRFIALLIERKVEQMESGIDKNLYSLLSRVIKKKLVVSDTAQKLAMSGIELILLAGITSNNEQQKSLYLNKAKSVLGIATSQTITEREEQRNIERVYFNINERMTITVPKEFQENKSTRDLASLFVERLNDIYQSCNKEAVIKKNLEKLYSKIVSGMESTDDEYTEEEFAVLHYYMNDVLRRIDDLEG